MGPSNLCTNGPQGPQNHGPRVASRLHGSASATAATPDFSFSSSPAVVEGRRAAAPATGHRPPEGSSPLSPPSAPPGCSVALLAPTRFSLIRVRSWIVAVRVREWWCWGVKSAAAMLSRISQLGARLLRENRAGTHPFRVSLVFYWLILWKQLRNTSKPWRIYTLSRMIKEERAIDLYERYACFHYPFYGRFRLSHYCWVNLGAIPLAFYCSPSCAVGNLASSTTSYYRGQLSRRFVPTVSPICILLLWCLVVSLDENFAYPLYVFSLRA